MGIHSRTGLCPSPIKKLVRPNQTKEIDLKAEIRPAPFMLKPLAGLYNPYPYGCSLLCNHPTDDEAKELLKRVKDYTWVNENTRNILLGHEIKSIREGLDQLHPPRKRIEPHRIQDIPIIESVPEELFRRYTDTDSRPLTPAPTISSAATRASGSRRCVTPDPTPISKIREKTLLVLDLRRSHSQELLYSGTSSLDVPLICIQHVPSRNSDVQTSRAKNKSISVRSSITSRTPNSVKRITPKIEIIPPTATILDMKEENESVADVEEDDDDIYIKRRGKKRRKRRSGSRGPPAFQTSIDPETQVGTIGVDSHDPSARPSLVPGSISQETVEMLQTKSELRATKTLEVDSFLDIDVLKLLRRELTAEIYDNEFNFERKKALEEALRTIPNGRCDCDELAAVRKELNISPLDTEFWIKLPRIFTRSSTRFDLPADSRVLKTMTPMEYIKDNVFVNNKKKLLYNCIFNKFKIQTDLKVQKQRTIPGKCIQDVLDIVMGKKMSQKQADYFRWLVGWKYDDILDFKTFCCLAATCERLLAGEFCRQLPDRIQDPCHEVEAADFETLSNKLHGQNADERLIKILYGIKNL